MTMQQAKADALAARLATGQPGQGGWLGAAQAAALARLRGMGLPGKRDEYWRYTDPTSLNAPDAPSAALFDSRGEAPPFSGLDRLRLVFVDGIFDQAQSDDPVLEGIEIERLGSAALNPSHWAAGLYGTLETRGQTPVERPFAALNTAQATEGVLIRVTGRPSKPVSLIYLHKSERSDAILHHFVKIESGAELTLLENGPAAARLSKVLEVEVADTGRFHHIRTQGRDHERRAVSHIFARIGAGALFKSFTLTANGRLTRNEAVLELAGADAVAHIAGASVGDGDFHHDDTVFVTHAAERCESRQVYKKVLKNGAVGVFQGKILVKQGAQKTDGYQISQSLLLDEDSQFLAKPELEIYADDVKCSHGSTSGAIDDTALYYLRSRGVPLKQAQSLLVLAFLAEAIAEIEDEAIAEDIRARLEAWLHRHEH
ncbi:Fe-S cluster assembly protein SufD [Tabrizicola oligotrophica]|uniref:Fe-S cluster assembly protein SufD n=1 Tax=Tabrizicola oligotrophica TaxID=2710650 RepID=A0A6M0QNQ0_9RHOB|nr:Fe-S cluster assembly protein SufD [Tabrizicola oligotrophica]NEY89029.1 Fe-S cluster assembly protein SufD [Tabrizicola oligotrophica]